MAKPKRNIIDMIRKEYPEVDIDCDIITIVNHPKFKNSMMQYINKWYVHKTPSKQRRFFIWVTKYPTGNSEKKMKVLFGRDKQGYRKWTFDRRSKRPNCVEYYTIRGFSDEEAIKKVSESQKKINNDGVDKRVLRWHDTFSKKTKEEIDQINISKGVTLEKCIEKHDDLKGRFVWNEILKKKDNTSLSSIMNRRGVDLDTANQIKNNIKHKQRINSRFALEYWNNLYPDDDKFAMDMFRLSCSTRIHFSKQSCIEKYNVFGWTETFRIDKEFLLNKIDELKSIGVVETFKNLKPGYY